MDVLTTLADVKTHIIDTLLTTQCARPANLHELSANEHFATKGIGPEVRFAEIEHWLSGPTLDRLYEEGGPLGPRTLENCPTCSASSDYFRFEEDEVVTTYRYATDVRVGADGKVIALESPESIDNHYGDTLATRMNCSNCGHEFDISTADVSYG